MGLQHPASSGDLPDMIAEAESAFPSNATERDLIFGGVAMRLYPTLAPELV